MNNTLLSDINDLVADFIKQNNRNPEFLQIGKKQVKELESLTYSVSSVSNVATSISESVWGLEINKLEVDNFLDVK